MADPYASIPLLAFDYTFNTLLARPDASQQQRQWLQEGKQEFLVRRRIDRGPRGSADETPALGVGVRPEST